MENSSTYPRQWTTNDTENCDGKHKFTLVTYNLLRDAAIWPDRYSYCPAEIRYMSHRYPRIIQEIHTMDADIVCLQEVDEEQFDHNLQPDLGKLGYQGIYHTRIDGFGLATFYKANIFDLIQQKHCYCHHLAETALQISGLKSERITEMRKWIERPIAVLLTKFKHIVSGEVLNVANIHVERDGLKYPALQALQIAVSVNELVDFSNCGKESHMICGDFNTTPDYPGYQMLADSHITAECKQQLKEMRHYDNECENVRAFGLVDIIPVAFELKTQVNSAYLSVLGTEPRLTTMKHCLDYIWFSQESLDVVAVLETPTDSAITKHVGLPSQLFPSDHISLKAEFVFRVKT